MSKGKGDTLVRSPPGLVAGVDAFSPHLTAWEPQLPKKVPSNGGSSVTKLQIEDVTKQGPPKTGKKTKSQKKKEDVSIIFVFFV